MEVKTALEFANKNKDEDIREISFETYLKKKTIAKNNLKMFNI